MPNLEASPPRAPTQAVGFRLLRLRFHIRISLQQLSIMLNAAAITLRTATNAPSVATSTTSLRKLRRGHTTAYPYSNYTKFRQLLHPVLHYTDQFFIQISSFSSLIPLSRTGSLPRTGINLGSAN